MLFTEADSSSGPCNWLRDGHLDIHRASSQTSDSTIVSTCASPGNCETGNKRISLGQE